MESKNYMHVEDMANELDIHTQLQTECEEPPKIFWKYYDLYRRKRISLSEYASSTGLSTFMILHFLRNLEEKRAKIIEDSKQL